MLKINEVSYCNFKLVLDYSLSKKHQFQQFFFKNVQIIIDILFIPLSMHNSYFSCVCELPVKKTKNNSNSLIQK